MPDGFRPDVALINWYGPGATMGMHVDSDEGSLAPVVSFSVGRTAGCSGSAIRSGGDGPGSTSHSSRATSWCSEDRPGWPITA